MPEEHENAAEAEALREDLPSLDARTPGPPRFAQVGAAHVEGKSIGARAPAPGPPALPWPRPTRTAR